MLHPQLSPFLNPYARSPFLSLTPHVASNNTIQTLNHKPHHQTSDPSDIVPKAISNDQPACIVRIAVKVDADGDEHHFDHLHDCGGFGLGIGFGFELDLDLVWGLCEVSEMAEWEI
jgi:hypothetical protein